MGNLFEKLPEQKKSICEGIEEQIGSLVIDDTFRYESVMLPIDILVLDLTKDVEEDV